MAHTVKLGIWQTPSGNACAADLTVEAAGDKVAVAFSWQSPPTPEDRDTHYEIVLQAMGETVRALESRNMIHLATLELWLEGKIALVRTTEDGQRIWQARGLA